MGKAQSDGIERGEGPARRGILRGRVVVPEKRRELFEGDGASSEGEAGVGELSNGFVGKKEDDGEGEQTLGWSDPRGAGGEEGEQDRDGAKDLV